jgi:hypothetical protein
VVCKLGEAHPQESFKHHLVDPQTLLNTVVVCLDKLPEQSSGLGVCRQVRSTGVDILRGDLAGEEEFTIVFDELGILGPSKRSYADLSAIDRVGRLGLLLQDIVFSFASFGDVDPEDRRTEVGVDGRLVSRSPSVKSLLGLRNDPVSSPGQISCG